MTDSKQQSRPSFFWRAEAIGPKLTVRFAGALDIAVLTECVTGLAEPLAGPESTVEFDAVELSFADSSALRFLLDTKQQCEAAGKEFVLAGRSRALSRLLEVSGLTEMFATNDGHV
jgi:anti-anti-sigma factor